MINFLKKDVAEIETKHDKTLYVDVLEQLQDDLNGKK
jgi:hypothetical protein